MKELAEVFVEKLNASARAGRHFHFLTPSEVTSTFLDCPPK
jgi:hypothetical protein